MVERILMLSKCTVQQYKNYCPKQVDLILEINKSSLLHLVALSTLFTYIDDARSNTNQVFLNLKSKQTLQNVSSDPLATARGSLKDAWSTLWEPLINPFV